MSSPTTPPSPGSRAVITYRLLVSLKEAGSIIGQRGATIESIRTSCGVKAGLSAVQEGCSDRVLTVAGPVESVSKALGEITGLLAAQPAEAVHHYKFLNHILGAGAPGSGTLRILLSNNQISTVIGSQGARIKSLISTYGVKIVASKYFLPDSGERIMEIQGGPPEIANALTQVSEYILEDFDIQPLEHYVPHNNVAEKSESQLHIPADFVGTLIGKGGNRVKSIRNITNAKVDVAKNDVNGERLFTVSGTPQAVKKAVALLTKNLEVERERRR